MKEYILEIASKDYKVIIDHLLPGDTLTEQAAFGFTIVTGRAGALHLKMAAFELLHERDFTYQTEYYLELTNRKRAALIKRAHDMKASLVEFHSHPFSKLAMFSESDISGFSEFVPHVMWRLSGRPYVAVVVTAFNFDALIWTKKAEKAHVLSSLKIGNNQVCPSRLTYSKKVPNHEKKV